MVGSEGLKLKARGASDGWTYLYIICTNLRPRPFQAPRNL